MSLRQKLGRAAQPSDPRRSLYERFGVMENPYPPAGQPTGHPRFDESSADEQVVEAIRQFQRDYTTQVVVIEGTQGVGKTNLLNYYQQELQELHSDDNTFYIIRYYPDPEPTFDAIVRRIFQELSATHLLRIGEALQNIDEDEVEDIFELARSYEVRIILRRLRDAAAENGRTLRLVADIAMEWFVGLRLLKKHRETLGVQFRLDTVESKTQALRDVVFVSERLELLQGLFLLLDELEKQDYSLSKTPVLRYLSAIRALIDSLPRRLFLMLALTSEARRRYFAMLPAIAGRLQNRIVLTPVRSKTEAVNLARFYLEQAKTRVRREDVAEGWLPGDQTLVSDGEIEATFAEAENAAAETGAEGVTHRDFLNRLRDVAEAKISASS